jgi:hypothetical protein
MSAIFALFVMLSITPIASASTTKDISKISTNPSVITQSQEKYQIKESFSDETIIYPMDAKLIDNVTHTGYGAYTGTFSTVPGNGKYLNIFVKNSGNSTVYMTITQDGLEIVSDYELGKGKQKTITVQEMLKEGLEGDYKLYIYNKTGDKYNLNINARQY